MLLNSVGLRVCGILLFLVCVSALLVCRYVGAWWPLVVVVLELLRVLLFVVICDDCRFTVVGWVLLVVLDGLA